MTLSKYISTQITTFLQKLPKNIIYKNINAYKHSNRI